VAGPLPNMEEVIIKIDFMVERLSIGFERFA
jgi:hypothetical protein